MLEGVTHLPLPADGIDRDGVLNQEVLGAVVRSVYAALRFKTTLAAVGVTGGNLVARVMEIPPVPQSEIRAVLRGEMDHYKILPAGQSAFDFFRLPDPPDESGAPHEPGPQRVLLMGIEERLVASYRAVADLAGLDVLAVEPQPVAVLRTIYPMLSAEDAVATVIIGNTATDICITHHGDMQFYRRVDTGIADLLTHGSSDRAGDQPEISAGGFLVPMDEMDDEGPAAAADGEMFNRQAVSVLMTEVQRSIDYYVREYPSSDETMQVRVSIDDARSAELFEMLAQFLRRRAEMVTPFDDSLPIGSNCEGLAGGPEDLRYTTAIGLALRGAPGLYAGAPHLDLSEGDRVIRLRRAAPRAMILSLSGAGLVLAGTVFASIISGYRIAGAGRVLDQTHHELDALVVEHSARVAQLDRQNKLVAAIHYRDKPLRQTIEFLSASIPRSASLATLSIDPSGSIKLSGDTTSPKVVADLMDTVNRSPALDPIRLVGLTQRERVPGRNVLDFDLETAYANSDADKPAAGTQAAGGTTTGNGGQ